MIEQKISNIEMDDQIRFLRLRLAEASTKFEKDYIIAQLKLLEVSNIDEQTLLVE